MSQEGRKGRKQENVLWEPIKVVLLPAPRMLELVVSMGNFYKNDHLLMSLFKIHFFNKKSKKVRTFNDSRSLLAMQNK